VEKVWLPALNPFGRPNVATPLAFSVPLPIVVPSTMKSTEPDGVPKVAPTVAVSAIACPTTGEFGTRLSCVVVGETFTVSDCGAEAEDRNCDVPA
jgi:hypothetical protein